MTITNDMQYVPQIDFVGLMKEEIQPVQDWLLNVATWSNRVATGTDYNNDKAIINDIVEMVIQDDYARSTDAHIELINFSYQTRYLSVVEKDLDMDILELYLGYICDRLKGLTPHKTVKGC